jgi:Zn-dependent protease
MNGGIFSFSLPVGHIAGILVRIHWTLIALWLIDLNGYMKAYEGRPAVLLFGIHAAALFGSILLHELGHAFAARRVGGRADEILLWPLGGLAFCDCPPTWRANLVVAAGGPLVTVLIVGASALVFRFVDPGRSPYLNAAGIVLVEWNLFILIFNLIPLYPMDGGRIFHALAWAWFGRHGAHSLNGHAKASHLTIRVSWVTAAAGAVFAYAYLDQPWIAVLLIFMVLESASLRRGA